MSWPHNPDMFQKKCNDLLLQFFVETITASVSDYLSLAVGMQPISDVHIAHPLT